jgi:hypothetical protein
MNINTEKLAEQFDELSALLSAIAGTFRDGGSDSSSAKGNGKTAKPVRDQDAAPAKGKSKAKAPKEDESELTIDDVREALKELVDVRGKEVMVQALESVGAGKLADVDESQYHELMAEVARLKEEEAEEAPEPKKTAKGKAKAKKAGPTAEDLLEKFKELVAADRKKAKAVLADLGVEKISEVEEDDIQAAMDATVAALEGDEDDLL